MTKLLYAASAAAILTVAGHLPAMAQSSGMSTPMITCRDLTTMDRDMARSVVFYVSGFHAASGAAQNQASRSGSTDTTGSSAASGTSGSTAADAGSGTSDPGAASGSTTAESTASGTSGSSGSDVTGSTSSASGSSDTSGAASGASSGASSAVVAQLPGFSSIDIDRIMSACANSPDRQISGMIGQGASGTSTTP